jgi:hypothetical protein
LAGAVNGYALGRDVVVGWDEKYMVQDSADSTAVDSNGKDGKCDGAEESLEAVAGSVCQPPQEIVVGVTESGSVYAVVAAERMV